MYRATPAEKRGPGFCGLVRRTTPKCKKQGVLAIPSFPDPHKFNFRIPSWWLDHIILSNFPKLNAVILQCTCCIGITFGWTGHFLYMCTKKLNTVFDIKLSHDLIFRIHNFNLEIHKVDISEILMMKMHVRRKLQKEPQSIDHQHVTIRWPRSNLSGSSVPLIW